MSCMAINLTRARPSVGDRLISSGEVTEERVVLGVLGEGRVSQAL